MNVLVTGGLGYIGSHTIVELINSGINVTVVDNGSNSKIETKRNIERITGKSFELIEIDIRDRSLLDKVFQSHNFNKVIHFAALKSVGKSILDPLGYYDNNIIGLITLLEIMNNNNVKNIIFSSSASVYGNEGIVPLKENADIGSATNPYGWTKIFSEQILKDLCQGDSFWKITILRYFNPLGAHPTGFLGDVGEDTEGLMEYILKVAAKELPIFNVFGGDYDTKDGTAIRDFIHIVDLAKAHMAAIYSEYDGSGVRVYNIGTRKPYTVLEVVKTFMKVNEVDIPYNIIGRREGDIGISYADNALAIKELKWVPTYGLEDMCRDAWRWYKSR